METVAKGAATAETARKAL